MAKALLLRVVLWLVLSLPVGIGAGALVSLYFGEGADLDRFTAAGNGVLTGAWLGLLGGVAAATTNAIARRQLREAGGSECITGAVVSYGLIAIGLVLLVLLA
jgi:hypothetical protein